MNSPTHPQAGSRPLLTLAMIVRDGGQLFASLLEAAAGHVDEIIIGDTGSRDRTPLLARRHGARVLDIPWNDDFAEARNAVLDQCTGRWILVLDADEQLAPADWRDLREWVAGQWEAREAVAAALVTRNYLAGRHQKRGWQPNPVPDPHALPGGNPAEGFVASSKVRLIPNLDEIRFAGQLHETLEGSLRTAGIPVVNLPVQIHHYGMLPDHQTPQASQAKARQYLKLARLKASSNPHLPCAWAELADCAIACGHLDHGLQAIDRALVLAPTNAEYRLTAGWLLKELGRLDEADRQLAAAAGSGQPGDAVLAETSHLRAQIAMLTSRISQAGPLLALAVRLVPDNGHFHNTLGAWHMQEGRGEHARQALETACRLCPENPEPLLNLGVLYEAAGQPRQAEEHFRRALELAPECEKARRALERLTEPVTLPC